MWKAWDFKFNRQIQTNWPTYKRGWNSESDQRHKRYLVLSEKLFLLLLLTIQRGYQLWTTTVKISITFSLSYRTCKSKLLTLGEYCYPNWQKDGSNDFRHNIWCFFIATTISVFGSADSSVDTGARNRRYLIVKSQTKAELISIDVYPVKTKERGRFSPYTTGGANYKNFHANIAYGDGVVIIVTNFISSSVFAGSQGFSFSIPFRVRRSVTSGTSS